MGNNPLVVDFFGGFWILKIKIINKVIKAHIHNSKLKKLKD